MSWTKFKGRLTIVNDWGVFDPGDEYPLHLLRKKGWFDKRRKFTKVLKAYHYAMELRMQHDKPPLRWKFWYSPSVSEVCL